jgi:hypothetical protein
MGVNDSQLYLLSSYSWPQEFCFMAVRSYPLTDEFSMLVESGFVNFDADSNSLDVCSRPSSFCALL